MARNALVDAGFLVALLSSRDRHHQWAVSQAAELPPPWSTCEAVLSEAFQLLGGPGAHSLGALLGRRALLVGFMLAENVEPVVKLIQKYSNVPMGFADACLVRMTETPCQSHYPHDRTRFPSLPSPQQASCSLRDTGMMAKQTATSTLFPNWRHHRPDGF